MKKKIGIIGYGNMGSAIAERVKNNYDVVVFDKDGEKLNGLSGIRVAKSLDELLRGSENVILAVKPQDFDDVLTKMQGQVENKLIISIAAGIKTSYIERILGNATVVRVMPNIGAKIGKSVTCLCRGSLATDEDLLHAEEVFKLIGKTQRLEEKFMNLATAVSGSGPGYFFNRVEIESEEYNDDKEAFQKDFIEELAEAAKVEGFDDRTAFFLASWTIIYSNSLLEETGLSAQDLKKQVTSKGGTTEAALEILDKGGSLIEAVRAAVKRAEKLSKE